MRHPESGIDAVDALNNSTKSESRPASASNGTLELAARISLIKTPNVARPASNSLGAAFVARRLLRATHRTSPEPTRSAKRSEERRVGKECRYRWLTPSS